MIRICKLLHVTGFDSIHLGYKVSVIFVERCERYCDITGRTI